MPDRHNASSRTLRLLSLLQNHRYWPGAELAERLEVSPRTLRRDIDRLRELGYPVDANRGVDGGYQLAPGATLPPLVVDDAEAVALAVGLIMATQGAVAGIQDAAVGALTKVVQVMPARLRRRLDALRTATAPVSMTTGPVIDATVLTAVAQTCRDSERLRFRYAASGADPTKRHVEPLRLVPLASRWYLLAWDLERHDWRTFRLDRLTDPTPTGAQFRPRALPGADPAAYVREHTASVPSRYRVDVVVQAPASDVERAVGQWATVTTINNATCRLVMNVHTLTDPTTILAAIGAEFKIVEPPELRTHLATIGRLFTRASSEP